MKSKKLGGSDPRSERNFVLVLDDGEEAVAAISRFAEEQKIGGASLTAIGAFKEGLVPEDLQSERPAYSPTNDTPRSTLCPTSCRKGR